MTDAAHERFQAFAQQMVDDRFGDLGGHEAVISWCLKAGGKEARLALLLTLLRNVEPINEQGAILQAIDILQR